MTGQPSSIRVTTAPAGVRDRRGFTRAELSVLAIVLSVQFINITEGVMLVPMGPFVARGLHMPVTDLGYVSGAYVLASCVIGLFNALMLDRFARRRALGLSTIGLGIGTMLGASAIDLPTMMAARIIAGLFGGTCSALSLAMIADTIAPEMRGRAMGLATAAFTAATVFGIPIGFQLAAWGSWRTPFFVIGALGLVVAVAVYRLLPKLPAAADRPAAAPGSAVRELGAILRRPVVRLALLTAICNVLPGGFIIPVLAPYFSHNLGYPEQSLGLLWAAGGIIGLFAGNIAGRSVDRLGPIKPTYLISVLMLAHWIFLFLLFRPSWPLMPAFGVYVGLNIARMTVTSTLLTQVTPAQERGRFLSLINVAQSGGIGIGAVTSATLLVEDARGHLGNVPLIIALASGFIIASPLLITLLWKALPHRDAMRSRDRIFEEALPPLAGD